MDRIDWSIRGVEFGGCKCRGTCPCQFEATPTEGDCRGFEAIRIDEGHFGEIRLDGLFAGLLYAWPGPVYEGKGELQAVIDERADERQREALATVLHGGETAPEATHWWVYHAMSDTVHETLYLPFRFEMDIEARTARLAIPGLLESTGSPIRSPVSGEPHRVRIDIPDGIEFELAEIGVVDASASGAIDLDLKGSYGQFNRLYHSGDGVVR